MQRRFSIDLMVRTCPFKKKKKIKNWAISMCSLFISIPDIKNRKQPKLWLTSKAKAAYFQSSPVSFHSFFHSLLFFVPTQSAASFRNLTIPRDLFLLHPAVLFFQVIFIFWWFCSNYIFDDFFCFFVIFFFFFLFNFFFLHVWW